MSQTPYEQYWSMQSTFSNQTELTQQNQHTQLPSKISQLQASLMSLLHQALSEVQNVLAHIHLFLM